MKIHGAVLARNIGLNVIGQVVPALIALAAIPIIVRGLGAEGFGLLTLAWVMMGYLKLLDLGLGSAITKFVAQELTDDGEPRSAVVWTALIVQGLLGLISGVALAIATPVLVERVFKIHSALIPEAHASFLLLAVSLPISLMGIGLRAVLEGHQSFGVVNAIQIPSNASLFLLPVIGIRFGLTLHEIIALLLIAKCATVLTYFAVGLRGVPTLRRGFGIDVRGFRGLLAFSGWVSLSNLLAPIMMYLDRFLISSVLSMSMLAYYHASFEIATRIWIVPVSMFTALFPAFSSIRFHKNDEAIGRIFAHSVRSLFLLTMPLVLALVMFADSILTIWLGDEFARHGALVLRILGVGVFFNSLGWVPHAILMGLGRPDIHVKIIALELPFYAGLVTILIRSGGITGVAIARAVESTVYAILAFASIWRIFSLSPRLLLASGMARAFGSFLLAAFAAGIIIFLDVSFRWRSVLLGAMLASLAVATWLYVFDGRDRKAVGGVLSSHRQVQGYPSDSV